MSDAREILKRKLDKFKNVRSLHVKCEQCCALVINGRASHEQGCPNQRKAWRVNGKYIMPDDRTIFKCIECGFDFEDNGSAYCDGCNNRPDPNEHLDWD